MLKDNKVDERFSVFRKRSFIITFTGAIITILLIIATLEVSHRDINTFVSGQQKYIIAVETAILAIFIVEMLVRLATSRSHVTHMIEHITSLRLIVRIFGYFIALMSVVSILASNATLGISVGAIGGAIIAFATQNILGSVIAAVVILRTHMVRVGEEITINQTTGIVSDINLTHTVISIDDDVVFIPNSLITSSIVRRKKRNSDKDASARDW
jgi:small conductance mechanosensitive channel